MKKALFASLLSIAALSLCLSAQAQVTIKDQAEYNAYTNAVSQTTPATKASAIEGFLTTYPNSVVKDDLLGQLMVAYTQVPDPANPQLPSYAKVVDAANRLLADDPNNMRALTLVVAVKGAQAGLSTDPNAKQALLDDAAAAAKRGLGATKPILTTQSDWDTMKAGATPVFDAALASDADGKKDYAGAEQAYIAELKSRSAADVVSLTALQDTFNLAVDYYQQKDYLNCAFYAARVVNFAPDQYKPNFLPTATYCFKKYIGPSPAAGQTFDKLQSIAATNVFAPATLSTQFTLYVAPKPEDVAHAALAGTADLSTLALQDKEYILYNGTQADADKVWAVMKDVRAEIPGKVVAATADSIQLAVSDDAVQGNTAEMTIAMKTPLSTVPVAGTTIKVDGTFSNYTKTPPMINLTDGEIPAVKKTPAARKPAGAKAPVHHTAH